MCDVSIFLFGNLPAVLEMAPCWHEAYSCSVATDKGIVYLDLSETELDRLVALNTMTILEQRYIHQLEQAEQNEYDRQEFRNG